MVDWEGRMLDIPRTKNEEAIHVPLNDAAIAALQVVHARGDGKGRVFQSEKTGEPLENGRHWFDDAVIEAGIKNFRWHDLRHVWATWHVMAGTTLGELQELGAWKSELMVKRYAHFAPEHLRAAADKLATFSYTPPKIERRDTTQVID